MVGKHDPLGQKRRSRRDRGKALAGKSTLNRLELTPADASPESRYKKIVAHEEQIESLFVDLLLQAHPSPPQRIVLDLDATDDPLYGHQEGRFFHGYYREYCYLPLYIFCGDFLLCAKLRTSDIDAAAGALDEVARIVTRIRQAWPDVRILLRGDSGFCREELMAWCEAHEVDFLFGSTTGLTEPAKAGMPFQAAVLFPQSHVYGKCKVSAMVLARLFGRPRLGRQELRP